MIDPILFIGLVVFAGFAANLVFERTKISQVLMLIAFGFLLGPILGLVDTSPGTGVAQYIPIVGTLALIILVFDGGISLNVFDLAKAVPKATVFTVVVFLASLAATAAFSVLALGWNPIYGILLGSALAGTSFEVVWAMLGKTKVHTESKSLLVLESTFTDDLSIITTVTLLRIVTANAQISAGAIISQVASSFSIALVAGAFFAILWLRVLKTLGKKEFPYMLTLGVVFLLYAIVDHLGANGGIAVFVFGLILGNSRRGSKVFNLKSGFSLSPDIAAIQSEVTFFTSTFFLVFLGMLIDPNQFTIDLVGAAVAISLIFIAVRWASRKALLPKSKNSKLVVAMLPRGLAAAVLAGLPASQGVNIPGFAEIALLVIVCTNIIATVGVFLHVGEIQTLEGQQEQKS